MARLRIKEIARMMQLDISKLARRADLATATVARLWNNEDKKPSLETLEKIATALGVRVADLLVEGDDE